MSNLIAEILFISDDWNVKEFYNLFNIKKIREDDNIKIDYFDKWVDVNLRKSYDLIIIDFGFITPSHYNKETEKEQTQRNINIILNFVNKGSKLAYCGGLSGRYCKQAKDLFPKLKFLHKADEFEIRDLVWHIYNKIEEIKKILIPVRLCDDCGSANCICNYNKEVDEK